MSGLRTVSWPYHQRGVVATVRTETPNHTAHQRFLGTGPLALLPVRGGFSNVVWSTTPPHAASLTATSPLEFAEKVNEVSGLETQDRLKAVIRWDSLGKE